MSKKTVAGEWEERLAREPAYAPEDVGGNIFAKVRSSRWIASLLKLPTEWSYLEAGCGLGRFGVTIAAAGRQVTLLDCSASSLASARVLTEMAEKNFGRLRVAFTKGQLERLAFADGHFDVVFNEGVLEHWLDRTERVRILKELSRVTKPGGLVSIRVVNNRNFVYDYLFRAALKSNIPPYHRYDLPELRDEMRAAGLEPENWDGERINDPHAWVKNMWLLKLLMVADFGISLLPKRMRERWCPSVFCTARVRSKQHP